MRAGSSFVSSRGPCYVITSCLKVVHGKPFDCPQRAGDGKREDLYLALLIVDFASFRCALILLRRRPLTPLLLPQAYLDH